MRCVIRGITIGRVAVWWRGRLSRLCDAGRREREKKVCYLCVYDISFFVLIHFIFLSFDCIGISLI